MSRKSVSGGSSGRAPRCGPTPALVVGLVMGVLAQTAPATAAPKPPPEDAARGIVHRGLHVPGPGSPCADDFELAHPHKGRIACTHGPDPAPEGVDVRVARSPQEVLTQTRGPAPATTPATAADVACYGDGTSGARVQLIYARAADKVDRYADFVTGFVQLASRIDAVFAQSAAETGGVRHVRFVTDASCTPVVAHVVLSAAGDDDLDGTINDLIAQGYTRTDRKYLVWVDANVYCGIGEIYGDDRATQDNYNNGNPSVPGMVARVDNACWGQTYMTEAHELMHTLGGVQSTAPHGTGFNHCTDEYDRMCYADGSGEPVSVVCPQASHEALFDCNHDDYYTTAHPAAPAYLSSHWNTADSSFLASRGALSGWGYSAQGQVGTGTATSVAVPAQVRGVAGAASVSAGVEHSLALGDDGAVVAWGGNTYGQLGDGSVTARTAPTLVPGLSGVTAVAAGGYHSLALRSDGTVRAWGWNGYGQLGDGTTVERHTPVTVAGITQIAGIAAGYYHSVAFTRGGATGAWGWNVGGTLGDGTTTNKPYAVPVYGLSSGVRAVAAGGYHTLAITAAGTVAAWGWNGYGQLGDGTTTQRNVPIRVAGPLTALSIAGGAYHSLSA